MSTINPTATEHTYVARSQDTTMQIYMEVCRVSTCSFLSSHVIIVEGKFSGVAPGAKLAFMDLAGSSSGLSVPPVNTLYGVPYSAGARIFTNSWGSVAQGFSSYSGYDTDKYLYDHHVLLQSRSSDITMYM